MKSLNGMSVPGLVLLKISTFHSIISQILFQMFPRVLFCFRFPLLLIS